jgi:hypothetical protein
MDTRRGCGTLLLSIENHGADGRIKIIEDGSVQTLTAREGTGGNNGGLILEKTVFANNSFGGFKEGCFGTLCQSGGSNGGGSESLVAENPDVYSLTTGSFCNVSKGVAATLCRRDYKCSQCINFGGAIRRLTPLECCRL